MVYAGSQLMGIYSCVVLGLSLLFFNNLVWVVWAGGRLGNAWNKHRRRNTCR